MMRIYYRISGQDKLWDNLSALRNYVVANRLENVQIVRYELKEIGRSPATMLLGITK
jgi:hypothetical protein